jgi:hypothetical protein
VKKKENNKVKFKFKVCCRTFVSYFYLNEITYLQPKQCLWLILRIFRMKREKLLIIHSFTVWKINKMKKIIFSTLLRCICNLIRTWKKIRHYHSDVKNDLSLNKINSIRFELVSV